MEPLLPNCQYHIYNHSNGTEKIFKEEKNYYFFLERYKKYIGPVVDTYAYCLMPNHFHLLVQIKNEEEILKVLSSHKSIEKYKKLTSPEEKETMQSAFISKRFSNMFSSYSQAFNKVYERRGSLFMKNFKRKKIEDEAYFKRLINYIHLNPVKHGFTKFPENWNYSSYNIMLSDEPSWLLRDEIINLFGDIENFKYCHIEPWEIQQVLTFPKFEFWKS